LTEGAGFVKSHIAGFSNQIGNNTPAERCRQLCNGLHAIAVARLALAFVFVTGDALGDLRLWRGGKYCLGATSSEFHCLVASFYSPLVPVPGLAAKIRGGLPAMRGAEIG
jgi:hypothetical protein